MSDDNLDHHLLRIGGLDAAVGSDCRGDLHAILSD
jgi:hypothetical protein